MSNEIFSVFSSFLHYFAFLLSTSFSCMGRIAKTADEVVERKVAFCSVFRSCPVLFSFLFLSGGVYVLVDWQVCLCCGLPVSRLLWYFLVECVYCVHTVWCNPVLMCALELLPLYWADSFTVWGQCFLPVCLFLNPAKLLLFDSFRVSACSMMLRLNCSDFSLQVS